MPWHNVAAYFFGGVFLANFVPHFVAGVSGRSFHSPFASPPFRGLSSPAVNIAWGLFNLAVAYPLLLHVGEFRHPKLAARRRRVCRVWRDGVAMRSFHRSNSPRTRRQVDPTVGGQLLTRQESQPLQR